MMTNSYETPSNVIALEQIAYCKYYMQSTLEKYFLLSLVFS